jgi:hypothetical protein
MLPAFHHVVICYSNQLPPPASGWLLQMVGSFELLRPSVKDILYTLEVNTFKDGLLKANDHAGE